MVYSFDDAKAKGTRSTQYFEMFGNRAIYRDGWVAASRIGVPWVMGNKNAALLETTPWELYNIDTDFSEATNLASKETKKLDELKAAFDEEAKKYNVYPLDVRMTERFDPSNRIAGAPKTSWTYTSHVRLPFSAGPYLWTKPFVLTADVTIPPSGGAGVISCAGGATGGWSLFLYDGKLNFHYNYFDFDNYKFTSTKKMPTGKVQIKAEYTSNGPVTGGTLKLFVNNEPAGELKFDKSNYALSAEPFEVGQDAISQVSPMYKSKGAFPFNGKIDKIAFNLVK